MHKRPIWFNIVLGPATGINPPRKWQDIGGKARRQVAASDNRGRGCEVHFTATGGCNKSADWLFNGGSAPALLRV